MIKQSDQATVEGDGDGDGDGSLESVVVDLALSGKLDHVGLEAGRKYRQAGVPLTIQRGDVIVRIFPDGREETVERLPAIPYQLPAGVRVLDQK